MKLEYILDLKKTLLELDNINIRSKDLYGVLNALYTLNKAVNREAERYVELYNKILHKYGTEKVDAPGHYDFVENNGKLFEQEITKLKNQEFRFNKRNIPKFEPLTPKQYRLLKEFFNFV